MFLELELLIASFILFLMLFCAFEAFDRLSGGQIMKLEKELEVLKTWEGRGKINACVHCYGYIINFVD